VNHKNLILTLAVLALSAAAPGCGSAEPVEAEPGSVIADYGPLVIGKADFDLAAGGDLSVELERRPWSAWWNPMSDNYMYNGPTSPLAKYDAYAASKGIRTNAAEIEERNRRLFTHSKWAGHCHAWAYASLLADEPIRDSKGFTPGEQKALLIKLFWNVEGLKAYGQKNTGRNSDYNDIYPDQFHRLVVGELFEKKQGFVMDRDPGEEVWNYPVYGADFKFVKDAGDKSILHVTLALKMADPQVYKLGSDDTPDYEYRGTRAITVFYTYDLKGRYDEAGNFRVQSGVWTGASADYHPDFVTVLPASGGTPSSNNDQVRADLVSEITGKAL
jgi:hypothetical protein